MSEMEKTYRADFSALDEIAEDIESFCSANGISPEIAYSFNLCADEVFTNIVVHGYKKREGAVGIKFVKSGPQASMTISDSAPEFDPLAKISEADLVSPVETRKIGGLGIFLLKKNMDCLSYERKNGMNILKMTKNL